MKDDVKYTVTIKVDSKEQWQAFRKLCQKLDTTASREIRKLMRDKFEENKDMMERLF